jgi:glyoxylase-like metal-dependent hydrolase (beta-lactamase superfamily II)
MTDELLPSKVYRLELGRVNVYLVDDGETTLIDAGTPNAVDDLRAELNEAGYDDDDIDRVLITHFDLDHVGTLAHLEVDGPIYAMEPDASFLDGSRKPPLSNHKGLLQRLTDFWFTRPSQPVQRLDDGDSVGGSTRTTCRATRPGIRSISTLGSTPPSSVTSWPKRTGL